jgi:hypothetical protein
VTAKKEYKPVRVPVGHPDQPAVELEPSWATWHGDHIEYVFDGYDWDIIQSWKTPGEKATWRLNVLQAGRYHVTLNYGCRPLDAGGRIRLQAAESVLEHRVHSTATADQFETFEAGVVELPAGKTTLSAIVAQCPGEELMRLNRIDLRPAVETVEP